MFKPNGISKPTPQLPKLKLLGTLLRACFLLALMSPMQGCLQTTRGTVTKMNLRAVLKPVCVPPIRYSVEGDTGRTVNQIRQRNQTCANLGF